LLYAQSHQNDPLGAAVVQAVMRVIAEEDLIARGRRIAATLVTGLEDLMARNDRISALRARGLMVAVELRDNPRADRTARVQRALIENGFVLAQRPGLNVLRLDPALTIGEQDIADFLTCFEKVLAS
jgi:acetylornithine aminotransferase